MDADAKDTRLWLVRHAPVAAPRGIIHGPEAPADIGDAAAFAALRARLPAAAAVLASPARRTQETAAALGLAAIAEPAFREQNFGAWTGRRHADLERELGAQYHAFWRAAATNRPPGGESFVDQIARVRDRIAAIPAGDAVLVVHSGTVRAALAIALDMAPEAALRFVVHPLSLTRIDRLAGGWRVVCVNSSPAGG
jgi:alpha-ribazole phosphatase